MKIEYTLATKIQNLATKIQKNRTPVKRNHNFLSSYWFPINLTTDCIFKQTGLMTGE